MITIKQNQKNTTRRRQEHQPILGECVGVDQSKPRVLVSDLVLILLDISIKGRKVNIGRGLIDAGVSMRCLEDARSIS